MNISPAFKTVAPPYQQLTNKDETVCNVSKQSATGSSSVSLAPFTHRTHSSSIDPSLACQTPVGDRAVETKTEPSCQKKSVTIDDERTGRIKKADRIKATKELHSLLKDTENLEDLTNDKILDLIKKGADVNAKIKNSGKKTALHLVALRGNKRIIERLVAAKADVNARTEADYTVMQYAHKSGSITPLIRLMVNAGFKIDAPCDDYGATMLIHAAREHNWELVEFLLDNGADINDQIDANGTVFHLAARLGQLDKIEMLIKHVKDVNVRDNNGQTALHLVAKSGHREILDKLLELNADVNVRDNNGQTALHLVAKSGHREILDKLLELNADVNAQDNNGRTPLYLLTRANGQLDTIKYFMNTLINNQADIKHRDLDGRTPLAFLVKSLRDQNAIKYVIDTLTERKADINACDLRRFTPLHFAASHGKLDVFNYLLEKGADKCARTISGEMVLELAESNGQNTAKMLESLYNDGLDVSAPCDSMGGTPIAYAAQNRQWKLFDFLISRGAKIDAWQNEATLFTPLHNAALNDQKDIVSELLKRKAKVNLPNIDGYAAIHFAVTNREGQLPTQKNLADRHSILVDLIKHEEKVDINAQDKHGKTALHIAVLQDSVEMVEELLKQGADFNILDEKNKTAFDYCRRYKPVFNSVLLNVKGEVCKLMEEKNADVSGKAGSCRN